MRSEKELKAYINTLVFIGVTKLYEKQPTHENKVLMEQSKSELRQALVTAREENPDLWREPTL